jgi:hypothetical protein
MERTHRLLSAIVRGARWGLPWIAILALSTSLASAVTFAVAGAPTGSPATSGPAAPSAAAAALADVDDGRASVRVGLTVPDGSSSCGTSGSRPLYTGSNSWIGAEPEVTPCAEGGP